MLLISISSLISPTIISSNTISTTTSLGLPHYWTLVIIGLMMILSLKEIISPVEIENKDLNDSLNIIIIPLVFCFAMIMIYKVVKILSDAGL